MKYLSLLWLLPAVLAAYMAIASAYPYYATWDSTEVYTLDALLTGAGQLPDHFFHPNMIPLVLERLVFLPLGRLMGWTSASSITALQASPNPYLAFAETAEYLIHLGYFFAIVFLSFMYLSIFKLFAPELVTIRDRRLGFFVLTLAGLALVWQYLPFMLIWVRYETVGLAFWSIALYATLRAAEAPGKWRFIVLAGICSGAAVFSKVQLIGGVALLPGLYAVVVVRENMALPTPKVRRFATIAVFGVAALLAVLHGVAYFAFTHHGLSHVAFDKFLQPRHFVPITPVAAFGFASAVAWLMRHAEQRPVLAAFAAQSALFILSFVAVLPLALLLGTSFGDRMSALGWTYIYSFMFGQQSVGQATGYFRPIDWMAQLSIFGLGAATLAVMVYGQTRGPRRLPSIVFGAGLATVSLAVLAAAILIRSNMRKDGLMQEAWLLLGALVAWRLLLDMFSRQKMLLLGCAIAWIAIGYQVVGLARFHANDYHIGDYDYSINHWRSYNYGFRGRQYEVLMAEAYPSEGAWRAAFRWSTELSDLKLLFSQVFGGRSVPLVQTALAVKGNRVVGESIHAVSPPLAGALLVRLRGEHVMLGIRADLNFFLLADKQPRRISGKVVAQKGMMLETEMGVRERQFKVWKLYPGAVEFDLKGVSALLAVQHRTKR